MADLIVGETTCDGKKKMYELLGETRPVYVLELPQKVDDEDALAHWRAELRKFRAFLEDRFGVTITDQKIREAIAVMNRERELRRELASLMAADRPPLTGRQLLKLKSSISGLEAGLRAVREGVGASSSAAGRRATVAAPVRVLMTGVPHGPRSGARVGDHRGEPRSGGRHGELHRPEAAAGRRGRRGGRPAGRAGRKVLPSALFGHDPQRPSAGIAAASWPELYRPECVIDLIWQACLTYDVESHRVKRFVEEELGLPYLRIETDYSPSDSARIAVRVEALFETIRAA